MIHTAKRLVPFAKNKVIHIEDVTDPVLLRLLRNPRTLPLLRIGLHEIDHQYEILIPYQVDDKEAQLKRYIQWKLGTTVNLSVLRKEYLKYYLRLYDYGSPASVIRRWGLTPEHNNIRTEEALLEAVGAFGGETGVVAGLSKDKSLYKSVVWYATKANKTVKQYLTDNGFTYRG